MIPIAARGRACIGPKARKMMLLAIAQERAVAAWKAAIFLACDPDASDRVPRLKPGVDVLEIETKSGVWLKSW
jgi:hypothetical protein